MFTFSFIDIKLIVLSAVPGLYDGMHLGTCSIHFIFETLMTYCSILVVAHIPQGNQRVYHIAAVFRGDRILASHYGRNCPSRTNEYFSCYDSAFTVIYLHNSSLLVYAISALLRFMILPHNTFFNYEYSHLCFMVYSNDMVFGSFDATIVPHKERLP